MGWGMPHPMEFRSRWPPGSSVRWSYHTSQPTDELIPMTDNRFMICHIAIARIRSQRPLTQTE